MLSVVLFVDPGYFPGSRPCPDHATAAGQTFCIETVRVGQCTFQLDYGQEPACPRTLLFLDFRFSVRLEVSGGYFGLSGSVTEPNGTVAAVALYADASGPPSENWTNHDRNALVEWSFPYVTLPANNSTTAPVVLGVYPADLWGA